jgi:tubulin--tyrosine ligase-like protein 12
MAVPDGISALTAFVNQHKPQLQLSGVPEHFWPVLQKKLANEIFDAGEMFSLLLLDYGEDVIRREEDPIWTVAVTQEDGLKADDPNSIYLIDHCWTFTTTVAKQQLQQIPGLLERLCTMMGINNDEGSRDERVEQVLNDRLWRYCNTYSVNAEGMDVEDRLPYWYVMDELGTGILHNDDPNFRLVPFIYLPTQTTFSLLFPIVDVDEGEQVFRDFVEGVADEKQRNALLLPWRQHAFYEQPFVPKEPDVAYFLEGHIKESLPEPTVVPVVDGNRPLRVYTEYEFVKNYLTDPCFEVVDTEQEADVLWLTQHFKLYKELSEARPNTFINQFPFENVITIKDLLSIVCRRGVTRFFDNDSLNTSPAWLPTTYNLKTDLAEFASYYQNRAQKGLNNHWIIKPWNLARGLDQHITRSLPQIMRLSQTGPKIAQKYIDRPVLFQRDGVDGKVKFDVRYVILLKNVDELEAYTYNNFFLRFANKPFAMNDFDCYEKHFTVMNYVPHNLHHLKCADFLDKWADQYPQHPWTGVEAKILTMLREMLTGATAKRPPCGIADNPQSRALYAIDLMLAWDDEDQIQPKLLEVNFTPDCKRACEYYPQFYNDIFKLLFLDQVNLDMFKSIC